MNPNEKSDLQNLLNPITDIKKIDEFMQRHQFHNIAFPHDGNTCEECIVYRKLRK